MFMSVSVLYATLICIFICVYMHMHTADRVELVNGAQPTIRQHERARLARVRARVRARARVRVRVRVRARARARVRARVRVRVSPPRASTRHSRRARPCT